MWKPIWKLVRMAERVVGPAMVTWHLRLDLGLEGRRGA